MIYEQIESIVLVRRHNVVREIIYFLMKISIERSCDRGSNTGLVNGWTNDGGSCAVVQVVAGYVSQVRNSRYASVETFAYLLIFENSRGNFYSDRKLSLVHDVLCDPSIVLLIFKFGFWSQLKSHSHFLCELTHLWHK